MKIEKSKTGYNIHLTKREADLLEYIFRDFRSGFGKKVLTATSTAGQAKNFTTAFLKRLNEITWNADKE